MELSEGLITCYYKSGSELSLKVISDEQISNS